MEVILSLKGFQFQPYVCMFHHCHYRYRYLVTSIELENVKISYVGVALNKDYSIAWIKQVKQLLWICCEYLDTLKPEVSQDYKSILLFLHTLVSFTSTKTWGIVKAKNMEPLVAGLNQLCANLMGHLFMRGFYLTLKVRT